MGKAKTILLLTGLIAALTGCSDRSQYGVNDTAANDDSYAFASGVIVPDSVRSATLYLYCTSPSFQTVYVHRATAGWSDSDVTWSSFAGAYDSNASGSFLASAMGWRSVDVTGLVKNWIGGTHPNHGFLLDQQVSNLPRGVFFAKENIFMQPYLVVCYGSPSGDSCEQFPIIQDATINQSTPNINSGFAEVLMTGYAAIGPLENQGLLYFDLPTFTPPPPPPPPDDSTVVINPGDDSTVIVDPADTTDDPGCTRSASWWFRHCGCGPRAKVDEVTALLPLWLGTPGGNYSVEVDDPCKVSEYLNQSVRRGLFAPLKPLLAELLAAKLNVAGGADDADIASAIAEADAFLASKPVSRRNSLTKEEFRKVHEWRRALHQYNVGESGPGACDSDVSNWARIWRQSEDN